MNTDDRIAMLEAEIQRSKCHYPRLMAQPVQNTKILVGNLAQTAKSALKINKKKDAGYEK